MATERGFNLHEDYVSQDEVESFLTDLLTKVGIKDAAETSKSAAGMLYGNYDYGYDWDDEEYDWDDEDFDRDEEEYDFDFDDDDESTAGSSYTIDEDGNIKIDIPEVPSINFNTDLS